MFLNNKGFTLVEIAIAMVVIGLLTGGVLKGQELIEQAKMIATVSKIKSFVSGVHTFKDKYASLPGDMLDAELRLPNCSLSTNCISGDGSGFVGFVGGITATQAGMSSLPEVETTMFWKHLTLSDIVQGVDSSSPVSPPMWGVSHPSLPLGGGLEVTTTSPASAIGAPNAMIFKYMSLPGVSLGPSQVVVSPSVAHRIDSKMDDENPDSGYVMADYAVTGCDTGSVYGSGNQIACVMYFMFDRPAREQCAGC